MHNILKQYVKTYGISIEDYFKDEHLKEQYTRYLEWAKDIYRLRYGIRKEDNERLFNDWIFDRLKFEAIRKNRIARNGQIKTFFYGMQ